MGRQRLVLVNFALASLAALLFVMGCVRLSAAATCGLVTFKAPCPWPAYRSGGIDYSLSADKSSFFVYLPPNYDGREPFGLIVYISSVDRSCDLPVGWEKVLEARKLIFVSPQGAGNSEDSRKREGLAVMAAQQMMRHYSIDSGRVYAAGLSGGGRIASCLGFHQSDVFKGTIQSCGTDFYRDVPMHYAKSDLDSLGKHYGLCLCTFQEIAAAKANTRFALITGSRDFRQGNILDIYYNGYAAENYRAKLFDVPGMEHADCSAAILEQALDFIR